MKRIVIYLMLALMMLFTGCSKQKNTVVTGPKIYYVDKEETKLVSASYTPLNMDKISLVEEYILALRIEPEDQNLKLAKPKDVNILGYNFGEAGQLQLIFDDNYHKMTGISEVLMRAAIVKTFTQIDSIDEVEFFVNGLPLRFGEVLVGRMDSSMFIDSVGEMTSYSQTATISIFFANETGDALLESQRQVEYDGNTLLEEIIVQQLIDGPTTEEVGRIQTVHKGTVLNSISVKDRVCSIDLNEKFLEPVEGVRAEVTIYSIVNTLAEQANIDKVRFTINGELVSMYKSIPFDQVFERKLNLMMEEE